MPWIEKQYENECLALCRTTATARPTISLLLPTSDRNCLKDSLLAKTEVVVEKKMLSTTETKITLNNLNLSRVDFPYEKATINCS